MEYAPVPTEEQLTLVREALGSSSLTHLNRIDGGLGCTMDVLGDAGTRLVLRRYGPWYADRGEDAAARENRALELLQSAGVPAPSPIWVDTDNIFNEQAIVTSFISGSPDLTPSHPFEWAESLARVLARVHAIGVSDEDAGMFLPTAGEDERKISENPEMVLQHPLGEDLLRRRIQLGQARTDQDQVFSHSDFWPGNTLWNDGDLVGVVDWEAPGVSDPEMDVAYCSLDIRYLGMDKVADRFIETYREVADHPMPNLDHWEAIGLCRPMPDIGNWVPAWVAMGRSVTESQVRDRQTQVIESFLDRTA